MKIYRVGGSVRDELLGLPVQDRDYVVVGATPEEMVAQGFKPVGADFPVFLHPQTHQEYALARTERKSGKGYKGFTIHASPDVTLEEDLARRDLTINAMAMDEAGNVIDPYGGQRDLAAKILRHVGPAFAEDPVRILRVARFMARFADRGFRVADETMALMRGMVEAGEADHLVAERVWQEISRGLMEERPDAMLETLEQSGALKRVAPELKLVDGDLSFMAAFASLELALEVRFAAMCLRLDLNASQSLCDRWKVPASCREHAVTAIRGLQFSSRLNELDASEMLEMFDVLDALRRPERVTGFFWLFIAHASRLQVEGAQGITSKETARRFSSALDRLKSLDLGAVAQAAKGQDIPAAIHAAKLHALEQFLNEQKGNTP